MEAKADCMQAAARLCVMSSEETKKRWRRPCTCWRQEFFMWYQNISLGGRGMEPEGPESRQHRLEKLSCLATAVAALVQRLPSCMDPVAFHDPGWSLTWLPPLARKLIKTWLRRASKMATRMQKQTVWAPWIKNLAETLEPHLVEIKQQGESKLRHAEPLSHRKLHHAMLHWENRRAATTARHRLQTSLRDIRQTKQVSTKCHVIFPQPPLG
jgi:hypothetical protein